jgi:hypothetical protein
VSTPRSSNDGESGNAFWVDKELRKRAGQPGPLNESVCRRSETPPGSDRRINKVALWTRFITYLSGSPGPYPGFIREDSCRSASRMLFTIFLEYH